MSASGHLQPASSLSPGGLLPGAHQPSNGRISYREVLNVSSHRQQSFKLLEKPFCEGLESAISGRLTISERSVLKATGSVAQGRMVLVT